MKGSSSRQDKFTQVKQLQLSTARDLCSGCPKHISLVSSSAVFVNLSLVSWKSSKYLVLMKNRVKLGERISHNGEQETFPEEVG
jgi:hypothetical protein